MFAYDNGLSCDLRCQGGVAKDRVLIKTPATWAGIRATERLEREGVKCLVTLVCSGVQGRAAAEAGASIIATCEPSAFQKYAACHSSAPVSALTRILRCVVRGACKVVACFSQKVLGTGLTIVVGLLLILLTETSPRAIVCILMR